MLAREEAREGIDAECVLKVVKIDVRQRVAGRDAGVGEEDVELAVILDGTIADGQYGGFVGGIGFLCDDLPAT
jgi:hypothetical protein